MRVGTDVFAGLIGSNHVLVGLKARGTSDPRKHLCLIRNAEVSSGGRHLGLARRSSARWSFPQVSSPVGTIILEPTCTSLMNMMMSSTRGVLVTGEDTCKQISSRGRTIERTLRRVSSAMFVSFGVSLGGAVGPIEDGTDVFAGLITVSVSHVLVGLKARGTSDPRKHL